MLFVIAVLVVVIDEVLSDRDPRDRVFEGPVLLADDQDLRVGVLVLQELDQVAYFHRSVIGEGHTEYESKWQEIVCKAPGCKGRGKHRATTLPAPFIVACPSGHIDDLPWREYVHRGTTSCKKKLALFSVAKTGTVADILVQCECDQARSASDALGERRGDALGQCTRRRPWLGNSQDSAACAHATDVRAMQRGATNAWFPVVRSALAVKEAATPIGIALNACNPKQIEKVDALDELKSLIDMEMHRRRGCRNRRFTPA